MALASCQSAPPAPIIMPGPVQPVPVTPPPPQAIERPASFQELPGWNSAAIEAPLSAFKRSCLKLEGRRS